MEISSILPWIQIVLSIILVIIILLQKQGNELGGALGGGSEGGATFHTRRGFEKFLFSLTIVVGILFAVSAFIALLL